MLSTGKKPTAFMDTTIRQKIQRYGMTHVATETGNVEDVNESQTNDTPDAVVLNLNDPFEAIVARMIQVNRAKREDYAAEGPLSNFYDSGKQLGLTAGHSVETLIATKQARLRSLLPKMWNQQKAPNNEGIDDTLLDRAVYSILAIWIWNEGGYNA